MGKKRKSSGRSSETKGPGATDPSDARLGPITTYEDVANSEDEFFLGRDEILLDDEPDTKKRKKEDFPELSDEEIYGYNDTESEADNHGAMRNVKSSAASRHQDHDLRDGAYGTEGEDEVHSGWWGSSKQEYYNAKKIETEADALEEEAEAKRLLHKNLSKMKEEDFVFDCDEWLATAPDAEESTAIVTEVLKDAEVTDDMTPEETCALLTTRYPEFEHLYKEFQNLLPLLENIKTEAAEKSSTSLESIKHWVLGCYVAALASYFAILTSPARDDTDLPKPLSPSDFRDHDVMETLVLCRDVWEKVKYASTLAPSRAIASPTRETQADQAYILTERDDKLKKNIKSEQCMTVNARHAKRLAKTKAIEDDVADLYNLPLKISKKNRGEDGLPAAPQNDNTSDFGEEEALDARVAVDKAARKKSLKFYTSQIVQKASRRAGAGRDAGGDIDIPYRERLRDRQARLLAEAEKRGKRNSKFGAALGDNSGEEDDKTASAIREDEDSYYDTVVHASKKKREERAERYAAYAAAGKADKVVEKKEIGEDGRRKVTYAIEKNKGLAPKRSKDVRNPRVRRKKQYDAKLKKLRSMRPVWQGGEPKGGYQGETSGINTRVVKSIKL